MLNEESGRSSVTSPSGQFDLPKHGQFAQRYHQFLFEYDPLHRWEDIGPLSELIGVDGLARINKHYGHSRHVRNVQPPS